MHSLWLALVIAYRHGHCHIAGSSTRIVGSTHSSIVLAHYTCSTPPRAYMQKGSTATINYTGAAHAVPTILPGYYTSADHGDYYCCTYVLHLLP